MSMSKIIPREKVGDLRAWGLPPEAKKSKPVVADEAPEQKETMTVEEIESIQKQAYDEGFAEGRKDGFNTGHQEGSLAAQTMLHEKSAQFDQLFNSLNHPFEDLDAQVEEEVVTLALMLAENVIRHELMAKPESILSVVRECIDYLPVGIRNIQIRANPADAALIREAYDRNNSQLTWNIIEDSTVAQGGFEVKTEHSQIDATFEKRITTAIDHVLGMTSDAVPAN